MSLPSRKRQGYVLLPVAITVALIATLAFLLSRESSQEVSQVAGEIESSSASYLAQAGVQHALQHIARQGCGPYSDLTDVSLDSDTYNSVLTADTGTLSTYTLGVDQDTHIKEDRPIENMAVGASVHIQSDYANKTEHALVRYDLSAVPVNSPIVSATAWFYLDGRGTPGVIDVRLITSDWTENDATWASMNANIDAEVLTSIPAQASAGIWVPVNLTNQVQAWINGEVNYGIALTSSASGVHERYSSRESANSPRLEVVVGAPNSPLAQLSVSATLANGLTRTITRDGIALRQYPAQASQLQLGSGAGQDTVLDELASTSNYGNHELELKAGGNEKALLLQFDLPPIPPGAKIVSAQLELYHYLTLAHSADSGAEVYRVTRRWLEGTQNGGGSADGATWDSWNGNAGWKNAGGDYAPTPISRSEISLATNDWESWEIAELVQGWIDEDFPNHGLLLKGSGSLEVAFSSAEEAIVDQRPRLTIRYACVCGEVCALPGGAGDVLLVVANAAAPVDLDLEKQRLLESWGYSVKLIDQNDNQAIYNAEFSANDVVLVSETATSNNLADRLRGASIGVILLGMDHHTNLGLSSSASWKVDTGIEITDNSHYITRPFGLGSLKIFNAGMELLLATGNLSLSSQTLAENAGEAGVVVIEAGGLLEGGGNAAGRRVMLPIGRMGKVNWAELNGSGRLLVQRALEWGTSNPPSISSGNLLMVVGDPDSLSNEEESKQLLFESWGFSVGLIDESDSQASFDNAVTLNDAVFLSEDVDKRKLEDKLLESRLGIVIEAVDLAEEFGFASGLNEDNDTSLVTRDTHYITLPLGNGLHTILTRSEKLAGLKTPLAPDIEIIGTSSAGDSLAALDSGDEIVGGDRAAGRRVLLPWGDGRFKLDHLNSNGLAILQRSLEWAVGANGPPMLMLVTADPANLTARETGLKTLFESWDYIVYLADDDDSQVSLHGLANALDVVYVPASVNDSVLVNKLANTSTGVVNESAGLLDDFGFSDATGGVVAGSQFARTSVSHYVSEPFAGGAVTHFNRSLNMPVPSGNLAPDLNNVASVGGTTWVFSSLDRDGLRWDGTDSAGRRIHLPYANAALTDLTADGLTLLERTLGWATGAKGSPSILAHWELDETAGTAASDSVGWNDAGLSGNPVWMAGAVDGALEFDGGSDFATTANNLRPPSAGSVAFWMKVPGAPTSDGQILGLDDVWEIRHVSSGTSDGIPSGLVFDLGVAGPNDEFVTTVALDESNRWYFVVATYDSESNAYQVYLDAELDNSGVFSSGLSMPRSNLLSIGRRTGSDDDFEGTLDDLRLYNYVLSEREIDDLYVLGTPNAKRYFELHESFQAPDDRRWEVVNLASYGVPANAVVEMVITNEKDRNEREGGVRAVGSVLQRRVDLHEAEGKGVDTVTMHVQADDNAQIEVYAENDGEVIFIIAGYWTGSTYDETFVPFDESAQGVWIDENLADEGIAPNRVVEILMTNTDESRERIAGVRANGATHDRFFTLHEAKDGGIEGLSLMVTADAASGVEVYSQDLNDVEFHVLGSWSDPPGVYTGSAAVPLEVATSSTWETFDLSPLGIPAEAIVQFALGNWRDDKKNFAGVRKLESGLDGRVFELHKAKDGGADFVSLHVRLDEALQIEGFAVYPNDDTRFYAAGWWVLTAP